MKLPISIIVPHLSRREEFFRKFCLPSIFGQETEQVIIEQDAETGRIDPRRASHVRNIGAAKATQEFLFFCDDDCILADGLLRRMMDGLISNPAAGFAYCDFGAVLVPGAPPAYLPQPVHIHEARAWDLGRLRQKNYISTMSLVRRSAFHGFDEKLERFQDWDVWLTAAEKGWLGYYLQGIGFWTFYMDNGVTAVANREKSREQVKKKHGL